MHRDRDRHINIKIIKQFNLPWIKGGEMSVKSADCNFSKAEGSMKALF